MKDTRDINVTLIDESIDGRAGKNDSILTYFNTFT